MTIASRARNADEAKAIIDREGVCVIEGVLDSNALARVHAALKAGVQRDEATGVQLRGFPFDPDSRNLRVFDLIGKDPVFVEMAEHPLALEMVGHVIGENFLLSNFSANITAPGSGAMSMHADQGYVPAPWPPYPMAVNVAWALDDFTIESGATRIVPGSHRKDHGPDPKMSSDLAYPVECPAGSVFVMDGRMWHQTGPNISADRTRAGLFAYYVRPFLRTQWNWYLTMKPEMLERMSPRMREMLGFGTNVTGALESLYLKRQGGQRGD